MRARGSLVGVGVALVLWAAPSFAETSSGGWPDTGSDAPTGTTADGSFGGPVCSADGSTSVSPDGSTITCAPYRCKKDGYCGARCDTSDECASGFTCDVASRTCVAPPGGDTGSFVDTGGSGGPGAADSGASAATVSSSGCGCAEAGTHDGAVLSVGAGAGGVLAVAVITSLRARRRRAPGR